MPRKKYLPKLAKWGVRDLQGLKITNIFYHENRLHVELGRDIAFVVLGEKIQTHIIINNEVVAENIPNEITK